MPSRVVEAVTRENDDDDDDDDDGAKTSSASSSTRPPSTPSLATSTASKLAEKPSLPIGKSVATTGQQSSSTKNNSAHHRNNSTTATLPPTNTSIPRPSEIPASRRLPSSSSSQLLSTTLAPSTLSYPAKQSGASSIDPRSPPNRRQPASRSSHGIETSTGPPPALITQRSHTTDSAWKQPASLDVAATRPQLKPRSETDHSIDSIIRLARLTQGEKNTSEPSKVISRALREAEKSRDKMASSRTSYRRRSSMEGDQDLTLRNLESKASLYPSATSAETKAGTNGHGVEHSRASQEDLFLVLAKLDSFNENNLEPSTKSERRRSHISNLTARQSYTPLPPSNVRPPSSGRRFPGHTTSSSQETVSAQWSQSGPPMEADSLPTTQRSSPRDRRYAASAHPLDQVKRGSQPVPTSSRLRSGSNRETSPELPVSHARRKSIRESSPERSLRTYKHSYLAYSTNGRYNSSPFSGAPDSMVDAGKRPQTHHGDGTASTVSTTAPSTIWDDVEDLKHRIRKLELTGKLPVSSDAAIATVFGERPPTATTTMTTISSSPKYGRIDSLSPGAATIRGPETADLHPLLHAALAKSKPLIDANIYKALEATASDALTLAAMATPGPLTATGGTDRQIRRKADNICRSLTELCISLTAEKLERDSAAGYAQAANGERSTSVHRSIESGQESKYLRASSEGPEMRPTSRVMSRLEARRASLVQFNTPHTRRTSPPEAVTPTQTAGITPVSSSRFNRPVSLFLRRTARATESPDERPTSRAITEIAHSRPSPSSAERAPREYTSQHPLPSPSRRSPSVQSSLPVRRSYFSITSIQSPATPTTVQQGGRRFLDRGTTPPSSVESARAGEMRRERMASLGNYGNGVGTQRAEARLVSRQAEGEAAL